MTTGDLPPLVMHPMVRAWACKSRTHCCRSWRVDVPRDGIRRMALACTESGDQRAALSLMKQHADEDGPGCALPMRRDGACMFLDGKLCGYRLKHGDETLPLSCTKFPYLGVLTPQRSLVGLSFACPTALDLLATKGSAAIEESAAGPPPLTAFCDFRGDDPNDEGSPASQFWAAHWSFHELFRSLEGSPVERLGQLAQRATGAQPERVEVPAALWSSPHFDEKLAAPLLAAGALRSVLAALWDDASDRVEPDDIVDDPDGDLLLNRYLDQRLLVPEFLITGASLVRLLAVLFAASARFRIERARGKRVMHAVGHIDRMILHSDYVSALFAGSGSEATVDEGPVDEMQALVSTWMLAHAGGGAQAR